MNGQTVIGSCPVCGCVIYGPTTWTGMNAPEVHKTCDCDYDACAIYEKNKAPRLQTMDRRHGNEYKTML